MVTNSIIYSHHADETILTMQNGWVPYQEPCCVCVDCGGSHTCCTAGSQWFIIEVGGHKVLRGETSTHHWITHGTH